MNCSPHNELYIFSAKVQDEYGNHLKINELCLLLPSGITMFEDDNRRIRLSKSRQEQQIQMLLSGYVCSYRKLSDCVVDSHSLSNITGISALTATNCHNNARSKVLYEMKSTQHASSTYVDMCAQEFLNQ